MDRVETVMMASKLILQVAEDMKDLSDSVQAVCSFLIENLSGNTTKATEVESKKVKTAEVTLEKVRGILAQKSQAGFTAEIRGIIQKYGANRLSEIDPKDYEAVIEDAEGLGNG